MAARSGADREPPYPSQGLYVQASRRSSALCFRMAALSMAADTSPASNLKMLGVRFGVGVALGAGEEE